MKKLLLCLLVVVVVMNTLPPSAMAAHRTNRSERVGLSVPPGWTSTAYGDVTLEMAPHTARADRIRVIPIGAQDLSALDQGMVNVTGGTHQGYRFLPHGMRFERPVRIHVPYSKGLIPAGLTEQDVRTFYFDEQVGSWKELQRVAVDTGTQTIVSVTNHFTDMINATITVPDHPQPLSYNPTSIKDMKAADPGAGVNLIEPPRSNSMGDARLSYPIEIPPGRGGMQPGLGLTYSSGGGNGWLGLGWDLPTPAITVDTRWGVPRYDLAKETETYLLNGRQLTPLANVGEPQARNGPGSPDKVFHSRIEGAFQRIVRHGDSPGNYTWEVTDKDGTRSLYGGGDPPSDGQTTLTNADGRIFRWVLREVRDLDGNSVHYTYAKVSDPGVQGGTVPGSQLYLKGINYTRSNDAPGAYTVTFIRDSELSGYTRRSDVIIDARGGFKAVTAELLKRIEVTFQPTPSAQSEMVRSYDLDYQVGAFDKTLLKSITQRGENGEVLGAPHEFTYYQEGLRFDTPSAWNTGADGVSGGLLGQGEASALSGAVTDSVGGHLYLGFNPAGFRKQGSIGAKLGFNFGSTQGLLALIDLNGDDLADKLFCTDWVTEAFTCGGFAYRPNRSGPNGTATFGDRIPITGLPAISEETSQTTSFGLEAYFGVSVIGNLADTLTTASTYFSDVNADGLPDLVHDGEILFNHLDAGGVPTFTTSSGPTPVPLAGHSARIDTRGIVAGYRAIRERNVDTFPLVDTVRRWVAPYPGVVQVTGDVALVKDLSDERQSYASADGVRVAIQHDGTELWATSIGPDDYDPKSPAGVDAIPVQKGDRLYFRVQSVVDGRYDQVSWSPEIAYVGTPASTDVNGLDVYRYAASDDFVLAGRPGVEVQVPLTGTVRLTGTLRKLGTTTDDVTLLVIKSGATVLSRTLRWNQTGAVNLSRDIPVLNDGTTRDSIQLRVRVDSPIDLRLLQWDPAPHLFYVATAHSKLRLRDAGGNNLFQLHPPYDIDIYPASDLEAPQQPWRAPLAASVTVRSHLAIANGDPSVNGEVTLTVKQPERLVAKRVISIVGGVVGNRSATFPVVTGDDLFFDLSTRDPELRSHLSSRFVTASFSTGGPPRTVRVPSDLHGPAPDGDTGSGLFAQPYRGWGYAGFNGNGARGSEPIDESLLAFNRDKYLDGDQPKQACRQDDYVKGSIEQGFDQGDYANAPCNPAGDTAYMFAPLPDQAAWQGPDNLVWVKAGEASSSRLGADTVDVPNPQALATDSAGAPARAVSRLSETTQVAISGGIGPAGVSGSIGSSSSEVDYLDLNGDRFPDIVSDGHVQYTTPTGDLEDASQDVPLLSRVRESANRAGDISLGGTVPFYRANGRGKATDWDSQMASLGLSGSLGAGDSDVAYDLLDVNGDGLPDRVSHDGGGLKVALNLGYSFADSEDWGSLPINPGATENGSLGPSLGFNAGIYDFAGGLSLSKSKSEAEETLLDVNGDGLLDRVAPNGDSVSISFNTGHGFMPPSAWDRTLSQDSCDDPIFAAVPGGVDWKKAGICDGNTGLGAGVYFTMAILLPPSPSSIIINPGFDASENMARQEATFRDVDGDGYLDHVASKDDGTLMVARNLTGRTNLLRSVSRPLGASFSLDYQRDGNTYDQPQSRWVLSRVSLFDGHPGDGVDTQVRTYRYVGGHYDRREREFYGYRTVIEEQRNAADGDALYRSTVRDYLNDGYYTNGLLQRELTQDAAGRPFLETENTYSLRDVGTGGEADPHSATATVFPELSRTDRRFYEGQPTPAESTFTTYQYDALGNLTQLLDAGDAGPDDDLVTTTQYSGCADSYVVGMPTDSLVESNGSELRHSAATVDCATGNMTQVRQFLDATRSADTDLSYFANGNLEQVTGPENMHGQRYVLTYQYDGVVGTHITEITDSFGYSSSATYNLKYGAVETNTDVNGNTTSYAYDAFGRVQSVTGPYEQGAGTPTISFEYHPEASVPWAITHHLDSFRSATDTLDTVTFVDGLKRVLQTKKDAAVFTGPDSQPADVMTVSGAVTFDFAGRAVEQRYPVTEPLGTPGTFNPALDGVDPTQMEYDVLDRVTKTTIPDGTSTQMDYGFDADRSGATRFQTTVTDANGVQKTTYKDVRDLVTAVKELNRLPDSSTQTIWTSYAYDPLGQLVEVKDDRSNTTTVSYDELGRKTVVDNPDAGKTETVYDLASDPIAKITANLRAEGKQISYDYDFTRLKAITYPDFPGNDVSYTYGAPGATDNRAGRVESVTDESGTEQRFYGKLGETTKEVRTIASDTPPGSGDAYTTQYVYDTFGRLQSLTYPDGEVLTYGYDSGGQVRQATGRKGPFTYPYVNRLEYDKFEQRAFLESGNGVRTNFSYRPDNRRLRNLQVGPTGGGPFQNLTYDYDAVGNVTSVVNDVPVPRPPEFGGPTTQTYTYDDLYRLTGAMGSYQFAPKKQRTYSFAQTYDSTHDILSKTQADSIVQASGRPIPQRGTTYDWTYAYEGSQPHAATHIGDLTYAYDADGNQVGWTNDRNGTRRTIVWDEENRIQSLFENGHEMTYKYDASGERAVKRGPQGETAYVNPYFTIRNREIGTKNVFVGATRMVSKLMKQPKPGANQNGPLPYAIPYERDQYFYHPDQLGSTNYVTDRNGDLYEHVEYFPFGETWVQESTNTQRTPYLFTSKELDEETSLYYFGARYQDPRVGQFLSADPLSSADPTTALAAPEALNSYAYGNNNPIKYVDRTGRAPAPASPAQTRQQANWRDRLASFVEKFLESVNLNPHIGHAGITLTDGTTMKFRTDTDTLNAVIAALPDHSVTELSLWGHGFVDVKPTYQELNAGTWLKLGPGGAIMTESNVDMTQALHRVLLPGANLNLNGCQTMSLAQAFSTALPGVIVRGNLFDAYGSTTRGIAAGLPVSYLNGEVVEWPLPVPGLGPMYDVVP